MTRKERIEAADVHAMRIAYHGSRARWNQEAGYSEHTGMEAAYRALKARHALRPPMLRSMLLRRLWGGR